MTEEAAGPARENLTSRGSWVEQQSLLLLPLFIYQMLLVEIPTRQDGN